MTQPRDPRRPPPQHDEHDEPSLDLGLEPDPVMEAPMELPVDALMIMEEEAPAIDSEEAPTFDQFIAGEEEEAIPLVEGFESTGIEERPARPRPEERGRMKKPPRSEFVFTTCPACEAPQPDPAPAFCDACGQRLRKPGKKEDAVATARTKRCIECGYKNREDATTCTNCGMRL